MPQWVPVVTEKKLGSNKKKFTREHLKQLTFVVVGKRLADGEAVGVHLSAEKSSPPTVSLHAPSPMLRDGGWKLNNVVELYMCASKLAYQLPQPT